ncbi:unnamed protein product [Phytophthora fragariaefolia]|uniref:Unnamed protein product n=1 Tax=Phytophthora fragariaefolia TaxID=1490495 RepID=A0A9W6Y0S0_9STRA|nr:unnamed protein product [Phytophthora fragariaefolia]
MTYLDGHPLKNTRCVFVRYAEGVPLITGFQISPWSDDNTLDKREEYASTALVLVCPFRRIDDLLGVNGNNTQGWVNSYLSRQDDVTPFTKEILANMCGYHCGRDEADDAVFSAASLRTSQFGYDSDRAEDDSIFVDRITDCEDE